MSYLTRPSNVRVYQFRQPPGSSRLILPKLHCPGTRGKTRTRNLLIRSQALYPLSYAGARSMVWNPGAAGRASGGLDGCDVSLVVQSPRGIAHQTDCTIPTASRASHAVFDRGPKGLGRRPWKLGERATYGIHYVRVRGA
jgi:hypothetical protein